MSLNQDSLAEPSKGKSGGVGKASSDPKYKYLADSINLESYKWAQKGTQSLKKEFHSAKSPEKKQRILEVLNAAIVRAELESSNPRVSEKRRKELKMIRLEFVLTQQGLAGKKEPTTKPIKKPVPKPNIDVESYEQGLEVVTVATAKARKDLDDMTARAGSVGFDDLLFKERYLETTERAIGKTRSKLHCQEQLGIEPDPSDVRFLEHMESAQASTVRRKLHEALEHQKRKAARRTGKPEAKKPTFTERPKLAKTYADPKRPKLWEVLENDYIEHEHELKIKQIERNIQYRQKELNKLGPRALKKREEVESSIAYWKRLLKQLKADDRTYFESTWQREYNATVKKAISKGKPVPQAVIDQQPEFKLAETARERYEKGRRTSFGNRTIAINEDMKKDRGFKVKRQDGKDITSEQIAEITRGIDEIEAVTGTMKDLFGMTDITIAHTSGKHPFLAKSGGQYSPSDRTVTTGVDNKYIKQPIPSLAHELGHWLDIEAGKATGARSTERTRKRSRRDTSSLAVHDFNRGIGGSQLLRDARQTMRDSHIVPKLLKVKMGTLTDNESKAEVEEIKVVLGPYWSSPSEIWARLVEQYVSDELRINGYETTQRGKRDSYVAVRTDYTKHAAYWNQDDFDKMKPMIKKGIERRISIIEKEFSP